MGKSFGARAEIARQFAAGTLKRVLWAVQATRSENSLADEAKDHFRDLGVQAAILLGRKWVTQRQDARQLRWSDTPEVKIISFAHLPHLFDRSARLKGLQTDLLVIDECPISALTHTARLSDLSLAGMAGGSALAQRLSQIMAEYATRVDTACTVDTAGNPRSTYRTRYLTGAEFLQAVGQDFSEQDWRDFADGLRRHSGFTSQNAFVDDWIETFRHDLSHPESGSHRFGVSWNHSAARGNTSVTFYSSILTPLRGLPPTLVLDAYAREFLYQALFPGHNVTLRKMGSFPQLTVEFAPGLRLHKHHMTRPSAHQNRLQVAEEIVQLQRMENRPVSVLVDKAMNEPGSPWQLALEEAARNLSVQALPAPMHHHAGRGKNSHKGHTIVSPTMPTLPQSHRIVDMAALFPTDDGRRTRAHLHLLQSEGLQMLHRGRQPETGSRIIVGYSPELPEHLVKVVEYVPIGRLTRGSNTPRWETAVQTVATELLGVFGIVPKAMLGALGLARVNFKGDARTMHLKALRQALEAMPPCPDAQPQLYQWVQTDQLPRFEDVKQRGKHDRAIKTHAVFASIKLNDMPLIQHGRTHVVFHQGQRGGTEVWAPPGVDVSETLSRLYDSVRLAD